MSSPSAVGVAVRQAARFDPARISWSGGLLAAIPVIAVLGIPFAAGDPVAGVTMGAGAMLVGVAWRVTGGRPPLGTMAVDALLMALSTFVGCVTGDVLGIHLVALAVWSLMGGLLVGLGNRAGAVGTQAIIAVVVFGRFSEPAPQALGLAGLVLAGGAAQVVFLTLVRWPLPLGAQRRATAAAYRELAELATGSAETSTLAAATALDEAEASLAGGSLFGDPALMTLRSLVAEGHRIRVELSALNGLSQRLYRDELSGAEIQGLAADVRRVLRLAADAIMRRRDAADELADATQELSDALDAVTHLPAPEDFEGAGVWPVFTRRLAALGGQLRAVASLAPAAGEGAGLRGRRPVAGTWRPGRRLLSDLGQLRANISLQSPATRHALRLAVVVPLATVIARELPLSRGYWMVVAASTVLRPEFGATFTRGTERAAGTVLGVALAGLIAAGLHPAGGATVALVGILAWLGYATFPASFAVGFAFITALVVFLLNVISPDTTATATARLVDTLAGAAIGLPLFLLWPTWTRGSAQGALARLVAAERRYLHTVLAALVSGKPVPAGEARDASRAARLARTQADSLVAQSLREPPTRRINARVGTDVLSQMRRLVQATHALRLDAQDDPDRAPMPRLAPLARAVDLQLAAASRALQTDDMTLSSEHPDLRAAYDAFAHDATPAEHALLPALDDLVDAANSLADLLQRAPPQAAASGQAASAAG